MWGWGCVHVQLIDNATIQLQNIINKLQSSGTPLPDEIQEKISYAQSLIRDVSAARQVSISTSALVQRFLGNQKTGWSVYYDLNLIIRLYFCNSNPSDEFCILGSIRLEVKLSHLNLDTVQYLFVFLEIYVSLIYIVLSCIFTECSWAVQLLLEFQGLAQECEGDSAVLSQRLKSMETELHSLVEKQLQVIAADMDTNLSFSR